jgi:cell volume regulation protein A
MATIQLLNLLLLMGALLLLAGVLSSLIATRIGAPLLVVFLATGMLLGPEGPAGLDLADQRITYLVGSAALGIILFDGGLRTRLAAFHGVLLPAALLSTLGVAITAGVTALAARWLFDLGWLEAFLVGAVVSATDAAAVFLLLRVGGLQLRQRIGATLEIESGTNDPVAAFLTIALVEILEAGAQGAVGAEVWLSLAEALIVGGVVGLAAGYAVCLLLNRLDLAEGLHALVVVAIAVATFTLGAVAGGSAFLAAYVAGLVVGNRPVRAYGNIVAFLDTATFLSQLVMFIMLGLLAVPSRLLEIAPEALGVAATVMLLARPLAGLVCLAPCRFEPREILFIGWVGLRGAVSIFLAAVPMLTGIPGALLYFDIAFFVVFVSLLVQGWTIAPAARRLGLALPRVTWPVHRVELDLPGQLTQELVGYHVLPQSQMLRHGRLPAWARPVLVVRAQEVLAPAEAGRLQDDDYVYILAPPERAYRLDRLFAAEAAGRAAEAFGEFPLAGTTPLGLLGELYGLEPGEEARGLTVAELFAARFDGQPEIGDRLPLGEAELVVRELEDDRVARVGLVIDELAAPLPGGAARLDRWAARLRLHARLWRRRLRRRLTGRRPRG